MCVGGLGSHFSVRAHKTSHPRLRCLDQRTVVSRAAERERVVGRRRRREMILLQSHSRFLLQTLLNRVQKLVTLSLHSSPLFRPSLNLIEIRSELIDESWCHCWVYLFLHLSLGISLMDDHMSAHLTFFPVWLLL